MGFFGALLACQDKDWLMRRGPIILKYLQDRGLGSVYPGLVNTLTIR